MKIWKTRFPGSHNRATVTTDRTPPKQPGLSNKSSVSLRYRPLPLLRKTISSSGLINPTDRIGVRYQLKMMKPNVRPPLRCAYQRPTTASFLSLPPVLPPSSDSQPRGSFLRLVCSRNKLKRLGASWRFPSSILLPSPPPFLPSPPFPPLSSPRQKRRKGRRGASDGRKFGEILSEKIEKSKATVACMASFKRNLNF